MLNLGISAENEPKKIDLKILKALYLQAKAFTSGTKTKHAQTLKVLRLLAKTYFIGSKSGLSIKKYKK